MADFLGTFLGEQGGKFHNQGGDPLSEIRLAGVAFGPLLVGCFLLPMGHPTEVHRMVEVACAEGGVGFGGHG